MSERIPRSLCALLGAGLVVYSGLVTQEMALRHFIDFNTIGLLAGMMILIGVVKKSGFFEAMALWSVKISKGRPKELLIILGLITGFCASFMDAVTAVLLITPMTISLWSPYPCHPDPHFDRRNPSFQYWRFRHDGRRSAKCHDRFRDTSRI